MSKPPESNPLIIPEYEQRDDQKEMCCPKCKGKKLDGRTVNGEILWRCEDCNERWSSGIPGRPYLPTEPRPPEPPAPPGISFERPMGMTKDGSPLPFQEVRRPIDHTQQFRRGVPEDDNDGF